MFRMLIFLMLSSSLLFAEIITFNGLGTATNFNTITTQGFNISETGTGFVSSGGSNFCSPPCPDNGTIHLMSFNNGTFTFSRADSSSFSMNSFDAAEGGHAGLTSRWATSLTVTGNLAGGGSVNAVFNFDGVQDGNGSLVDFENFVLPSTFVNLSSVVFDSSGGSSAEFSLDNVQVNDVVVDPEPDPVPEANSLILLILATALVWRFPR